MLFSRKAQAIFVVYALEDFLTQQYYRQYVVS